MNKWLSPQMFAFAVPDISLQKGCDWRAFVVCWCKENKSKQNEVHAVCKWCVSALVIFFPFSFCCVCAGPSAPRNVEVLYTGVFSEIGVTWDEPENTNGKITAYEVGVKGDPKPKLVIPNGRTTISYTLRNLGERIIFCLECVLVLSANASGSLLLCRWWKEVHSSCEGENWKQSLGRDGDHECHNTRRP